MKEFITENWGLIATALFAISEILAAIPSIGANSIFQMVKGLLKNAAGK